MVGVHSGGAELDFAGEVEPALITSGVEETFSRTVDETMEVEREVLFQTW